MLLGDVVGCDGDGVDGGVGSSTPLGHPRRWVIHAAGHPRRLVIQAAAWSSRPPLGHPRRFAALDHIRHEDALAAR